MIQSANKIEFHPVAHIFPLMTGSAFDDLVADIKAHGLEVPIELHEGKIIDGRNRYLACEKAGVDPKFKNWDGFGDLISHVVSLNLKRRHLDESQRAMVAAKIANLGEGNPHRDDDLTGSIDLVKVSQDDAAALMNVSVPSLKRAKAVQRYGVPELGAAVEDGRLAVASAALVSYLPTEEQKEVVANGEEAIAQKVAEIRKSRAPKTKPDNGKIIPQTRKLTGQRKAPDAIRGAIGTLVGLVSGFEHFTVKDAAPSPAEAAQWEKDLFNVISALNRFRRQLREHVNV